MTNTVGCTYSLSSFHHCYRNCEISVLSSSCTLLEQSVFKCVSVPNESSLLIFNHGRFTLHPTLKRFRVCKWSCVSKPEGKVYITLKLQAYPRTSHYVTSHVHSIGTFDFCRVAVLFSVHRYTFRIVFAYTLTSSGSLLDLLHGDHRECLVPSILPHFMFVRT